MNGPRFVRTGRCRLIICCGILILVIGMIAVFHSSQLQLDETKQERLHCEQQQEALNDRLTSLVEQKFHLEKHHERERNEQLENRRNLEQTIKELEGKLHTDKLRYDKLETTHKNLQKEQEALKSECLKSKKLYEEEKHKLEANLQRARSELQKEKDVQSDEIHRWKEKYNTVTHEKELEASVDKKEVEKLHSEIKALELELQKYHPTSATSDIMGINKPIHVGDASNRNLSVSEKSFSMQEPVSDGVYHITINVTEKSLLSTNQNTNQNSNTGLGNEKEHLNISNLMPTIANMAKPPYQNRNNRSLILNSVENFQIVPKPIKTQEYPIKVQVAPLGAPKNEMSVASSPATRSDHQVPAVVFATSSTTPHKQTEAQRSSNSPPLVMPPNQKKLPENVAPIPDNFETLLEKTNTDEVKQSHHSNVEAAGEIKSPKDDEMFHRYSMAKKIQEPKALALKSAVLINNNYEGMAAHDIKHHDNGNDQNFMMSNHNDDGAHFFDGENHKERGKLDLNGKLESAIGRMSDKLKDDENDDEEMGVGIGADNDNDAMASLGGGAAGDIAVKQSKNQLLDSDNLNNEVAADQGKEFGDLRMDEGDIDDGDDDDYSNPGDRIQGGKAIRN